MAPFAHPSEQQFALLLDFYGLRWEYEPRTFVLAADECGNVTSAFTPDFYLPDHDVYVELTTLRQPLVTRKNQKVRRLRERYPEVTVQVMYRRDLERLFARHEAA